MEISLGWKEYIGNFETAIDIIDSLDWNISYQLRKDKWVLFSGEKRIATFNNKPEMEAFLLGMALAIGVLPSKIKEEIRKIIE